MENTNPTETRIASIFKDENDIIIITMKDCGKVDEFDVLDVNLVLRTISENKSAYKILDARANWNMDKKAKEKAVLESTLNKTEARAIIVSNKIRATLLTFIQNFGKQGYPQKIFSNKKEAYDWIIMMKNKKQSTEV